jgi:hypothetical protein
MAEPTTPNTPVDLTTVEMPKSLLDVGATSVNHAAKKSASTTIQDLPNELLANIFTYLDTPQPSASTSTLTDEPKFELTHADVADLKASSCVSKQWREAILPLLFKHARFIVKKTGPKMPIPNLITEIKPFLKFVDKSSLSKVIISFAIVAEDRKIASDLELDYRLDVFARFWHLLFQSIDPVELLVVAHAQVLGALTSCFVFVSDVQNFDCPYHYLRLRRPSAVATVVSNEAVLPHDSPTGSQAHEVVEPVTTTLSTENVPEDLRRHESEVELVQYSSEAHQNPADGVSETPEAFPEAASEASSPDLFEELEAWQIRPEQSSTLFNIRPWSSLLLNEGSFIKAFSTYEFWLRQAPSVSEIPELSRPTHLKRHIDSVRSRRIR